MVDEDILFSLVIPDPGALQHCCGTAEPRRKEIKHNSSLRNKEFTYSQQANSFGKPSLNSNYDKE